jgi:hypothetical protein
MLEVVNSRLEYLVAPATHHLLPLLRDALWMCAERHQLSEGRGADNFSFGTDAWSLPARRFRDAIEELSIPFTLTRDSGCVLAFGKEKIRHHRVGWFERDDILSSFPGNARALAAEVERVRDQLSLGFPEPFDEGEPGGVVLAYMANPRAGLCAAYLAVVGRVDAGKIVGWSDTRQIYVRDQAPEPPPGISAVVPAEQTPDPVVRRIAKGVRDAG